MSVPFALGQRLQPGASPKLATVRSLRRLLSWRAVVHRDEVRHVHFGISHIHRRIALDPDQRSGRRSRGSGLKALGDAGLSPLLVEGLTVMAAGSLQPAELSRGADTVRELMKTMAANRLKRLRRRLRWQDGPVPVRPSHAESDVTGP
jgi:hypothetical protein